VRYAGGGVEIYLPPYFDWDMNDPTTVSSLRLLGSSWLEQFMTLDESIVAFASSFSTDYTEFGSVEANLVSPGSESVPLKKFVDGWRYPFKGGRLVSRSDLNIDGREATRLVVEGDSYSFAAFFVAVPDGFWIILYTYSSSRFPDRLADFDASAATFQLIP
jgi:hypothetical protein